MECGNTSGSLLLPLPSKTNSSHFSSRNISAKQHCPLSFTALFFFLTRGYLMQVLMFGFFWSELLVIIVTVLFRLCVSTWE